MASVITDLPLPYAWATRLARWGLAPVFVCGLALTPAHSEDNGGQAPAAQLEELERVEPIEASPDNATPLRGESAAETLPLPQPAPRPLSRGPVERPTPPPLNLRPDPTNVLDEVRLLAAAKRHAEALSLLRDYRRRHPHDEQARRLELAIEVDQNEHRMRALINDQRQERLVVLADPDYLTAKAAASRPVVRRLDIVEFLVDQRRFPEALSAANAILEDHPYDEAVLSIKNAILRTMVEVERRRALSNRDIRHREVLKDVIEEGTMPRSPQRIPRTILIFDEDLADIERQRIQDRLGIRLDNISYQNAPVGEVLRLLFAAVGMNYIILDEAISEQTVTMFLVDASVAEVLGVLQNMIDISFNYKGGTVYITNSATPILTTEIIRLASGLTNVDMAPTLEPMSGMEGGDSGGQGFDLGGNNNDNRESDLDRFLARLPDLVNWPAGSTYFLERKSNSLYVRSSPSTVAEVKRLLHALDFNNTQVLIEAKFVEVSESALHELGVDWTIGGFQMSGNRGAVAGGMTQGTGNLSNNLPTLPGQGGLFSNLGVLSNPELAQATAAALETGLGAVASPGLNVGIIGAGSGMNPNFEARLRALEGRGKANTLSEPKILTLSNSTGIIEISRDRVFVESVRNIGTGTRGVERDDNGNFVTTGSNVIEPVFASEREGIRLRVVPSVARNSDIVTLAVFPTIKQFDGFPGMGVGVDNPDTGGSTIIQRPQFSYRQLATALHVKNGQTVVLGGLITEETSESRSGIPFLSSIPFAGAFFRSERKSTDRRKLLIFVTARIIDPSGAEYGEEERWLRDTARVILPPEVQHQLRRQDRERQAEAEETLQQWQDRNSQNERGAGQSLRAGNIRDRMQNRR
ncbi:MAG: hypothetical protein EA402_09315 [Planctomycetota bacterium]|nr:MAG: hypothetical protein EA402_09315 [Planctomycetota bacterium]